MSVRVSSRFVVFGYFRCRCFLISAPARRPAGGVYLLCFKICGDFFKAQWMDGGCVRSIEKRLRAFEQLSGGLVNLNLS